MNLPPGVTLIDELRSEDRAVTLRVQPAGRPDPVILKVLHLSGADADLRRHLEERLRQWRGLTHPSIVRPLQVQTGAERVVLTLPDISTGSLADRLEMGAVSSLDIGDLCHQACTMLQAMHTAGTPHGNLKPSNLLIDIEGDLLVSDPQLMPPKPLRDELGQDDNALQAPEILDGAPPSPASDQYSLALILLALLTRQPPDQAARLLVGVAANGGHSHTGRKGEDSLLPARAVDVLRRALATDANRRWPSLAEFHDAFQEALGYQTKRMSPPRAQAETAPPPTKQPPMRRKADGLLFAPVLALFLCALVSIPVYSMGWFDRAWEALTGQLDGGGEPYAQTSEQAAELPPAQATPTLMSALGEDAFGATQEASLIGEASPTSTESGEGASEPTEELVSEEATETPSPTATSDGGSDPSPAKDPKATATPTPTSTNTPESDGEIKPNSCNPDPGHPRYCTPTPSP